MESNTITIILSGVLIFMVVLLILLVCVYFVLRSKSKAKEKKVNKNMQSDNKKQENSSKENNNGYTKQSIFDFMEFDNIIDNMIEQKNGKRYVMVIECQGVNFDLMLGTEKVSIEEGFQQFLNTLRHPIQIYIQTRTVNLESSIETYKARVAEIENKDRNMEYELKKMREEGYASEEQMAKLELEIAKQKNLLDYGKDIIRNTEKMSKNRNVLNKKYYVVIAYNAEELGNSDYDKDEVKGMAFSELYTKAQSLIRTLLACSVTGRILNSMELTELLYVAYNRDEAETYNIQKEIRSGVMELYTTSQDIFDKKMKILDQQIQDEAIDMANRNIERVKSKRERAVEKKQEEKADLVKEMAKMILEENQDYIGADVAQEAIKELEKQLEEEEKKKTTKKSTKRTTRKEENNV